MDNLKKLNIYIITFLISLSFITCKITNGKNAVPENGYRLEGITKGIADGTVVYLREAESGIMLDTSIIRESKFLFKGHLRIQPLKAEIITGSLDDYLYLWLENKSMTLDGTKSTFSKAIITGSESQNAEQSIKSKTNDTGGDRLLYEEDYVSQNPDSYYSPFLLSKNKILWGKKKTQQLYSSLSLENRNSFYGEKVLAYIDLNQEIEVGNKYADFLMPSLNDKEVQLSDQLDKVTLLEFWASWCGPCRKENPTLLSVYNKYKDSGFNIVSVSLDKSKASWQKAVTDDGLPWIHINDLKGDENKAKIIYGVSGIPDNFLIDKNGVIIGRGLQGDILEKAITDALN